MSKCPIPLENLIDFCQEADDLRESLAFNMEYGLPYGVFIHEYREQWYPIVEKYWESLSPQKQRYFVDKEIENLKFSLRICKTWIYNK